MLLSVLVQLANLPHDSVFEITFYDFFSYELQCIPYKAVVKAFNLRLIYDIDDTVSGIQHEKGWISALAGAIISFYLFFGCKRPIVRNKYYLFCIEVD